jgi:hypothetical protein
LPQTHLISRYNSPALSVRNKILLLVGALALLGLGIAWFVHLRLLKTPSHDALEAIPTGAFLLIESQDMRETWKKTGQGNLIWEELQATTWCNEANARANQIDSLLELLPEYGALTKDRQALLAFYITGKDEFHYVFTLALPSAADENAALKFVLQSSPNETFAKSEYAGTTILTGKRFVATVNAGIVIISDQIDLVKSGLEQIKKGINWSQDASFMTVRKTAGSKAAGNIYFNASRLLVPLRKLAHNDLLDELNALGHFNAWTELDATLRPNMWLMNGYSAASDSGHFWLSCFAGQEAQRSEMAHVIPANAHVFWTASMSNFETYQKKLADYSDAHDGGTRKTKLNRLKQDAGFDPATHFGEWIGNEFGYVITPGNGENGTSAFALIAVANTGTARARLVSLSQIDSTGGVSDSSGYSLIYQLNERSILPAALGNIYERLNYPVWAIQGSYVIFGENAESLRSYVAQLGRGKNLAADRSYEDFASNLSGESNLTLYLAPSRAYDWLRKMSADGFAADLKLHTKLLTCFDGFAAQFTETSAGLFYTSMLLRHHPQNKQEISSLWETSLDTTFSSRPILVRNHKTKGFDIFVQDDAHTIYLISNTGKVFWKKTLDEPIMGSVQQIDALKNEKLQLVFNTSSKIYVIDRNGDDLEGFPITLKSKATNELRVFDYEKNRDYRMLVACADKKTYNYDGKGKLVEGWKFAGAEQRILAPVQHVCVADKDYVITVDESGKIYITDRQGQTRLKLAQKLPFPLRQYTVEAGRDLARTRLVAADSLGNVYRVSFTDELEKIHFSGLNTQARFDYRDVTGDDNREFIFLTPSRLSIYKPDKEILLSHELEQTAYGDPLTFAFSPTDIRIGVVCRESNEIQLIYPAGTVAEGFPLFGNTPFSIGDLNSDGSLALVTGGKGKSLFAYTVR